MTLLLDTHVIIWALTNDPRLSDGAKALILSTDHIICYSVVSLWEIAIKNQKSPRLCPFREDTIRHYCSLAGYEEIDLKAEHVLAIRNLHVRSDRLLENNDPFDRILLAQAKTENYILLSHDHHFDYYDEACIRMI